MNKCAKNKKAKVPKLTEEQYANYVMSLKDEKPISTYSDFTKKSTENEYGQIQSDK